MGKAKSIVRRIVKAANEDGDISIYRRGRCGKKKKTTSHDDKMIIRSSVKIPWKTSKKLQSDPATSGVFVNPSIIGRRLLASGRIARKATKKQLLTIKMKKTRLYWAKKYRSWSTDYWGKVIFSVETNFEVCGYHSWYVKRSIGEPLRETHFQQAPKHSPKKMFWGFFTMFEPGSLTLIKRMMNSDKYKDILKNYLLHILSDIDSRAEIVFQQDLAPCHISKKMQTFYAQTDITLLDWPGNSSDLNPIENLCLIIKRNFSKYYFSTKTS